MLTALRSETRAHLLSAPIAELSAEACRLRDQGHGAQMTYSRKVFIPLTQLCRDVCHYCTFAQRPRNAGQPYLSAEQILEIARRGEKTGCTEALFTLGDKPELRYAVARNALDKMGYASTIDYLAAMCELVLKETSLLPHVNPGVMSKEQMARLRDVSVSQGIMLESVSARLCERGGVHFGSPDKNPALRLETIRGAGELAIPFTSGILIGIGETREERLDSLLALAQLHERYGHLQEIIVQNFRAKPGTKCAGWAEPDLDELLWSVACARIIFGPQMNIQAPPNLSPQHYPKLVGAGINDWGGVSPVTIDHVNPEAPWPELDRLRQQTADAGKTLVERLPIYPAFAQRVDRWASARLRARILRQTDSCGLARMDAWAPGLALAVPTQDGRATPNLPRRTSPRVANALAKARDGARLQADEIVSLFQARGDDFHAICAAADALRKQHSGDTVRYVVTRNINYTNVCKHACGFCAFSKSRGAASLRGPAYDLSEAEISRRTQEAWSRGATEVCMQGGIHPDYTGETYLRLLDIVKQAAPAIHVHAFSPLEVTHGAQTLHISVREFLRRLKKAGLGSLPGTAAEILSDDVRDIICPDKLRSSEWLGVLRTAHEEGLKSTSTIMFGHVDGAQHWARHLLALRDLQQQTGGITEFVPLPFVHMEAPLYHRGLTRRGPTFRETVLMHALARLVLSPLINNVQVSWVKLGPDGAKICLQAGANDMGGTLMNESISHAAGTEHAQELSPAGMRALIESCGRTPLQRTTLYETAPQAQQVRANSAAELAAIVLDPAGKRARITGLAPCASV